MTPREKAAKATVLVVPLAVYAVLSIRAYPDVCDTINPDAVAYLRNALYWSQGRFEYAVSSYWSPLLSWCVVPLSAVGLDPLHAAYVSLALWGLLLVVFSRTLLDRFGGVPHWLAAVALALVAESTVTWSATAFPDVILAACLMGSAASALRAELFRKRSPAVVAGALGGLGYLAKAYGLPFFLLHWLATVALLAWLREVPFKKAVKTWLLGLAAFALLALPWVAALSRKYETFTYGSVGRINHAIVGANDFERSELWNAVPGRVTVWETPEALRYRFWSPLEGADSLRHQIAHSWTTLKEIRDRLTDFDYAGLGLAAVFFGPFVVLALGRGARDLEPHAWTAATVVLFAAPFAAVYFTYRYTAPWLKPLTILAAVRLAWILAERIREADWPARRIRAAMIPALPAAVLVSFALHMNVPFTPYTVREPEGTTFDNVTVDSRAHRAAAEALRAAGVEGPFASTRYWAGMYLGYFLDLPFAGSPAGATAAACDEDLRAHRVRTFVVDRTWRHAAAFAALPGWTLVTTIRTPSGESFDVFVRSDEP